MKNTAVRFGPGISTLVMLFITLSGPAFTQGDSASVYLPLVFHAEIAFPSTIRISVASDGTQGNEISSSPSISADGRYVAFTSSASNLVSGDTNETEDVFVHDRQTGVTTRVSVSSDGVQGNAESGSPSISADGRFVAFTSAASNLVSEDTNNLCYNNDPPYNNRNCSDVFVHDMQNGITTRVSVASDGGEGNYWSGSFSVHTDNGWDPYSWPIPISADGRFVVFESGASNLASGDTNSASDVFVHDRETGETSRVSLASNGEQGNSGSGFPSLSADGRFVAFQSAASNLVSGDTNECDPKYGPFNCLDVFVHDRVTGETTRVSVASDGSQGNGGDSISPAISADGRYVAFMSDAGGLVENDNNNYCDYYYPVTDWNCVDIFIHDRQTGKTKLVSMASNGLQGNEHSFYPAISADGRLVAFTSAADNLVNSDTNSAWDVFVHDNQTGVTSRSSVDSTGSQANGRSWDSFSFNRYTGSWTPSLSMSGRFVAFTSWASNLVSGDNNEYCNWSSSPDCPDVFVRDRGGLDGHFP